MATSMLFANGFASRCDNRVAHYNLELNQRTNSNGKTCNIFFSGNNFLSSFDIKKLKDNLLQKNLIEKSSRCSIGSGEIFSELQHGKSVHPLLQLKEQGRTSSPPIEHPLPLSNESHRQALFVTSLALCLGISILIANVEQSNAATVLNEKSVSNAEVMNLAFLPEGGPMVEEFWENVSRYVTYFFTVATGGLYSLTKPMVELLSKPTSAILLIFSLGGSLYLTYVVLSYMLGLDGYQYEYPYG